MVGFHDSYPRESGAPSPEVHVRAIRVTDVDDHPKPLLERGPIRVVDSLEVQHFELRGARHLQDLLGLFVADIVAVDAQRLLQLRIGILFALFLAIGARARGKNDGLHKRMMILATALPLPAAINRIPWLPSSLPESPLSAELYILAVLAPMFLWDVVRNKGVHRAYWIWLGLVVPTTLAINAAWDTRWWHAAAKRLMGV